LKLEEKIKIQRKVPFLDLRINEESTRKVLLNAIDAVFQHGRIVNGPEVGELEEKIAHFCDRKYAIGVNSGTDALFLGLKALGIGAGDEVITTSLSWIATANAIALTGATPIFADIRDDLNVDPESVKRLITPKTKAIMPVHYTGKICAMDSLMKLAREHKLLIIEDASQAFSARYDGKRAGSFGDMACFSMNSMKIFASCGEAGIVLTDSSDIYDKLIALRYNGTVNKEVCIEPSLNGRLDTLQAAILLKRLQNLDEVVQKRREIAAWYNGQLADVVEIPREKRGEWDVYYTYTICADRRDELKAFLETQGVETKIQHPILMPEQPAYKGSKGEFTNAKCLVDKILSIPANEKLVQRDVDYVVACIRRFYNGRK